MTASGILDENEEDPRGSSNERTVKLTGEKAFTEGFYTVLDNVITTKKGIVEADRVIKFIGAFCSFATDHGQSPPNFVRLEVLVTSS